MCLDNDYRNLFIKCSKHSASDCLSTDIWHWSDTRGGVLRFELDKGVPLEPQNPYPSLKVILAEKGTHF